MADAPAHSSPLADEPTVAAEPFASGNSPLEQLARLIERDEAFAVSNRPEGKPRVPVCAEQNEPCLAAAAEPGREPNWAHAQTSDARQPAAAVRSPLVDGVTAQERPAPPVSERADPPAAPGPDDASARQGDDTGDKRRRRIAIIRSAVGLTLAGCAGALGHWAWSGGLAGGDEPRLVRPETLLRRDDADPKQWIERVQIPFDEADVKPAPPRQMFPLDGGVLYDFVPGQTAAVVEPPTAPLAGAASGKMPAGPPQSKKSANVEPGRSTTPRVEGSAAAVGSYMVQLSVHRSEEAAQASVRDVQNNYPDVFAGRHPVIMRVELADNGVFYRAEVGPFATLEQASSFCDGLKKAGGRCIVHN